MPQDAHDELYRSLVDDVLARPAGLSMVARAGP
jgi:hypothetical protein